MLHISLLQMFAALNCCVNDLSVLCEYSKVNGK